MELFFDMLRSIVYGVIEGITEWLPISSTGHMILAEQVLKFSLSAEFMEMFRVVIQLGAILAVVVLYFKKLWPFCGDNGRDSGLAKHIRWPVMRLWGKIIVACLPAAVLGLLLDDWMDAHLYNSVVVAIMLIVYGIAFILIERRPRVPTTTKLSRITYKQAVIVGAWQVLALIPGTSRSGATIIGVTDSELSPINHMASCSLLVRNEMISFVDSLAAPMSMLNALILAVASKKGADISSTFAELDHVWDRFGIFGKVEDE